MNYFNTIFFSIVLLGLIISMIIYWLKPDKYIENLQAFRKFFYLIFVVGVAVGIIVGEIKTNDWQTLLQLTALFVFIDIAVFQTPDILKIWNAEFQQSNHVKQIIKANDEIVGYHIKKVSCFTDIVNQTTNGYFNQKTVPVNWRQYKDELRTYLNLYADTFQLHISIFEFDVTDDRNRLKTTLTYAFDRAELCYNKSIEDSEWKETIVQTLLKGNGLEFKTSKDEKYELVGGTNQTVYLVPYFGAKYNCLIGIHSKLVNVDVMDGSHILNLSQIFDWYMT